MYIEQNIKNAVDRLEKANLTDQLNELKHPLEQRRRRRPWLMIACLIFVTIIFAWIIYDVLFYL
ncbi:hypothetical protein LCGC14_2055180 [marine sediment metagenome]|uniref:Uncharacterized protein n=1 Tax=marine sediment metagenome TaxID=412755 RepID=A0A0F9EMT6_9ZZZZ